MPIFGGRQFNGGVNEEDFLGDLASNEVRRADNAILTRRGSLRKREGSSEFGSDSGSNAVYALKGYTDNTGTVRRLKMITTTLVEYNSGPWSTTVKSGLTASLYLQMSDIKVASTSASVSGTASSGTDFTLVDTGAGWTVNAYRDFIVKITAGTGSGQAKTILENTADTLYVDGRWDVNPDSTSEFSIFPKVTGLICNNGTDTTFKVIGVTATSLSALPKFTSQVVVGNRLWGIVGSKIYWSDLANGEGFSNLNFLDAGEDLIALGRTGDAVAVYSKTKTGVVIGVSANDFSFKWRDYSHGCVSAVSVAHWRGWSLALAQDGVYAFDGTNNILMSRKITPSITDMNDSLRDEAFGFVFDNRYFLLHAEDSTSTRKDKMWVLDLTWSDLATGRGVWTCFRGLNANVMGTFLDSNGFSVLYFGASDSSKVKQLFDGSFSDSGSSISFIVETREYDEGLVGQLKKFLWFFYQGAVQTIASDLQLSKNIDNAGFELFATVSHLQTGGQWDVAYWDNGSFGGLERIISRQRPGGRGRTMQYQFYNNTADHPAEIFTFEQQYESLTYH